MERILFLVKAREFGGLEIVLLDWLSQIDYSKVSIVLCCYGTDTLRERVALVAPLVESVALNIPDNEPFWKALPNWLCLLSSIRSHKTVLLEAIVRDLGVTPVDLAFANQ